MNTHTAAAAPKNVTRFSKLSIAILSGAIAATIGIGGTHAANGGTTWDAPVLASSGTTWDAAPDGTTWDATTDGTTWDSAPTETPATTDGTTWD